MKDTAVQPPAFGGDDDWLVSMPKADLHVHLVGSAAPAAPGGDPPPGPA
jgi:hypothetical protein